MIIDILTLFPEMFAGPFDVSIIRRARERGLVEINLVNIRDFSTNRHRTVDDTPFGGGGGMIMGPEAIHRAVQSTRESPAGDREGPVVLLCPQGRRFTQDVAREYAGYRSLVLVCGHYEGIDERVRELAADDELSLGDFVLTGGELAAMVVVDAVVRLLPGVLGEPGGAEDDSYAGGLLEYPQYTRPRVYEGREVPEILVSGHHGAIASWRREEALLRTLVRRPDLLGKTALTGADRAFLARLKRALGELGL
ncbi:MAG: tRNA (guanosine(37)-N1)-methyltransferase TrmD [Bacillota bacterium]|nr:tRNA (guanosine(37)-N1)-methyltransferase TrmD [Bacillota bacterium]